MDQLWDPFDRAGGSCVTAWEGERFVRWSWDDWKARAEEAAAGLQRLGVAPGERVGCLLDNSPEACAAVLGTWMCGAQLVSIPLMPRGMDVHRYGKQLTQIVAQAAPGVVLAGEQMTPLVAELLPSTTTRSFRAAVRPGAPARLHFAGPDDVVFVQYSSGSTSSPKGCCLTARAIACQLAGLAQQLEVDPERDAMATWLPLSHDMGLFGCMLLSYWTSMPLRLSTPARFLQSPLSWLSDCAESGATISAAPSFALGLVARMLRQRSLGYDVPLTRLVIGGERVDADTLDAWCATVGPGMPRSALTPAYGLAEGTLAVTMSAIDQEPVVPSVDREALWEGCVAEPRSAASATRLVGVGTAMPGCSVAIDGGAEVGEILVESSSLADGYLDAPATTAARFTSHGLRTGDLGFLRDGQLFVTGRLDDLIPIAGRNVYAADVEHALCALGVVRPGRCAVVGVAQGPTTRLVALVEGLSASEDRGAVSRRLSVAARDATGAALDLCVFVEDGALPRTPSGKMQRHRCRQIAEDGPEGDGVLEHVALRGHRV